MTKGQICRALQKAGHGQLLNQPGAFEPHRVGLPLVDFVLLRAEAPADLAGVAIVIKPESVERYVLRKPMDHHNWCRSHGTFYKTKHEMLNLVRQELTGLAG